MQYNKYNGFLNVYKEAGWTSMDVCAKLRRILGMKKIGHAGTLDPMATGVLPVALGRATKDVDKAGDGTKVYRAGMLLGMETDTEDITGEIRKALGGTFASAEEAVSALEALPQDTWPSEDKICEAASSFLGTYDQLTPMYSARKVAGKKLYQYARAGIEVERKTRQVVIEEITIEEIRPPHVRFTVRCTKGTYIRTLCRDIGEKLGCGACMESLERLAVGDFTVGDALTLDQIRELTEAGQLDSALRILAPTALALGKFDGTHMGHQALLKELRKLAETERLRTCVLILRFGSGGVLTEEDRKQKLYGLGIDYVVELPFTEEMKNMSAEDFLEKILIGRYHMKAIAAGDDVSFGYAKRGNADFLYEHAEEYGYKVRLIQKVRIEFSDPGEQPGGEDISSTLLRKELAKGDMLHVTRLLGTPYAITGTVLHGRHLGTERMHFPTMNIAVPKDLTHPPKGVYAVQARIADAKGSFEGSPVLKGIANLGVRPTVQEAGEDPARRPLLLETHVFGEIGDCCGKLLKVELLYYIRKEERFNGLQDLMDRLEAWDIPAAEEFFAHFQPQEDGAEEKACVLPPDVVV